MTQHNSNSAGLYFTMESLQQSSLQLEGYHSTDHVDVAETSNLVTNHSKFFGDIIACLDPQF